MFFFRQFIIETKTLIYLSNLNHKLQSLSICKFCKKHMGLKWIWIPSKTYYMFMYIYNSWLHPYHEQAHIFRCMNILQLIKYIAKTRTWMNHLFHSAYNETDANFLYFVCIYEWKYAHLFSEIYQQLRFKGYANIIKMPRIQIT